MFKFKESISDHFLRGADNALNINHTNYLEYNLIRLLLGIVDIERNGKTISPRTNYSTIPSAKVNRQSLRPLKDAISPNNLDDLKQYLHKSNSNNRGLIQEILTEFTYFTYCEKKERHTQAFLHLYRTFEFISYSFPLIHASISRNYKGTFTNLKSYFSNNSNEISFLNKFTLKFLEGDAALDTTVDITIENSSNTIKRQIFRTIKTICTSEKYLTFDDATLTLSFQYRNTFDFFYFLRNRYFHFAIGGQTNLSSNLIQDPDFLFKHFNPTFSNWIAYLYIEILRSQIDRWK